MDELIELLEGINDTIDFRNEKALLTDGVLDSIDLASIQWSLKDTTVSKSK